jgi:uncharacterized protein (TIGR00375 family)
MSKFVADLHLHSSYARATSRSLNLDTLSEWAKLKGLKLIASADFTHPVWWKETRTKLKESKYPGFYEYGGTYFVLGTEISCIYSQGSRQRRTHCLPFFPKMSDVEKFNQQLARIGNLKADGRPILGMSAKQLLEIVLGINEKAIFIPAHVWTPWFSLYGSNSGFDSIEEAFGDLSKYIYAIETGLSSDPAMNWRIPELDDRSIVSFSDAHSAPKMGREATVFDTDFSYDGLLAAVKKQKIALTIEFFPEEGKYHYTGHRSCGVRQSPKETDQSGIICPKCRRKLTVGVMHRVEELADSKRPEGFTPKNRPKYKNLVTLIEIIAESFGQQVTSGKVNDEYRRLVSQLGSEMSVLLKVPLPDLEKIATVYKVVEGIKRVREGNIVIEPGFDGVYGKVKIWPSTVPGSAQPEKPKESAKQAKGQVGLFD